MISFIVGAGQLLLVLLCAYFQNAIPDVPETSLDNLIRGIAARLIPRWLLPTESKALNGAYTDFILMLSDQSLVTGLSVLIGGAFTCNISTYSFRLLICMSWLSVLTHFASLTVLRGCVNTIGQSSYGVFVPLYLTRVTRYHTKKHWTIRSFRLLLMAAVVFGLILANIARSAAKTEEIASNWCFRCALRESFSRYSPTLEDVVVTAWILSDFAIRACRLFKRTDVPPLSDLILRLMFRKGVLPRSLLLQAVERIQADQSRPNHRVHRKRRNVARHLHQVVTIVPLVYLEIKASFFWQVCWLAAFAAFGFGLIARCWLPDIAGEFAFTYGQLSPLILLLLPILAFLEGFFKGAPAFPGSSIF